MTAYPQMPPMNQEELIAFLNEMPIARMASVRPNGKVHIAAVWFKYKDGEFIIGTQSITNKVKNIACNPDNVTLLIDNQAQPLKGVIVYGEATLDYDNVIEQRVEIFERHMPHDAALGLATNLAKQFQPVIIRVKPTRISSYDYAKAGMF